MVGKTKELSNCQSCRYNYGKRIRDGLTMKKVKLLEIKLNRDKNLSYNIVSELPEAPLSLKLIRFLNSKGVSFKGNRTDAIDCIGNLGFEVNNNDEVSKMEE